NWKSVAPTSVMGPFQVLEPFSLSMAVRKLLPAGPVSELKIAETEAGVETPPYKVIFVPWPPVRMVLLIMIVELLPKALLLPKIRRMPSALEVLWVKEIVPE